MLKHNWENFRKSHWTLATMRPTASVNSSVWTFIDLQYLLRLTSSLLCFTEPARHTFISEIQRSLVNRFIPNGCIYLTEILKLLLLRFRFVWASEPVLGDGSGISRHGGVDSLGAEVHSVVLIWKTQNRPVAHSHYWKTWEKRDEKCHNWCWQNLTWRSFELLLLIKTPVA